MSNTIKRLHESIKVLEMLKMNGIKDTQLHPGQILMMMVLKYYLKDHDDFPQPSKLSEILYVKPATISPVINRLEEMGYIERRYSKVDRREVYIAFTEKGEIRAEEMHNEVTEYYNKLLEYVSEEDLEAFFRFTERVDEFNRIQSEINPQN